MEPPKKKKLQYDRLGLYVAYSMVVNEGASIQNAAKECGVPRTTLRDRVRGKVPLESLTGGKKTLFTWQEEDILAKHLAKMAGWGYSYTIAEVLVIATDYATSLKKERGANHLCLNWYYSFMKRNKDTLKLRPTQSLEETRARACTEENLQTYFQRLQTFIEENELSPDRIYNVDGKGLYPTYNPPSVVHGRGAGTAAVTPPTGPKLVTLLGCGSASGVCMPPFFIFPGDKLEQKWLELGRVVYPGAAGTVSETGWSNATNFDTFVKEHFMHHLPEPPTEEKPVLLVYDGHKSHPTLGLIDWGTQNHVHLFCLLAHTSHVCQPLEVACLNPVETLFTRAKHQEMNRDSASKLGPEKVCRLVCSIYKKVLSEKNLKRGFRKTGIWPCDFDGIPKDSLSPSDFSIEAQSKQTDLEQGTETSQLLSPSLHSPPRHRDEIKGTTKPYSESSLSNTTVTDSLRNMMANKSLSKTADLRKLVKDLDVTVRPHPKDDFPQEDSFPNSFVEDVVYFDIDEDASIEITNLEQQHQYQQQDQLQQSTTAIKNQQSQKKSKQLKRGHNQLQKDTEQTKKTKMCEELNEHSGSACQMLRNTDAALESTPEVQSDLFTVFGQTVEFNLRQMQRDQAIHAQKLIHDILYMGNLGDLSTSSSVSAGGSFVHTNTQNIQYVEKVGDLSTSNIVVPGQSLLKSSKQNHPKQQPVGSKIIHNGWTYCHCQTTKPEKQWKQRI